MSANIDFSCQEDLLAQLDVHGCTVKGNACTCPWHEDKSPSASILHGDDGRWRVYCHVCDRRADAIDLACEATGICRAEWFRRQGDQFEKRTGKTEVRSSTPRRWSTPEMLAEDMARAVSGPVDAIYQYQVPGKGLPALVVVRISLLGKDGKQSKTFRQAHYDGQGWVGTAPPKPWPLYNLPEVIAAQSVVVVEGEKAAEALRTLGITATTTPCGAGKADHADLSPLSGKRVVVWPDHDETGAAHGRQLIELLSHLPTPPAALKLMNVTRLSLPPKGDAVEFIATIKGDTEAIRAAVLEVLRQGEDTSPTRELVTLLEAEITGKHALVAWPWPMLTRASRSLLPGSVTILAGAPGARKSWIALQCMVAWIDAGVRVAALELEETKAWHLKRALAHLEGMPDLLTSEWCAAHAEIVRAAYLRRSESLAALGRSIWCEGNVSMERCAAWVEERCAAGCRVLVVDPITLADPGSNRQWEADRQYMARVKVAVERAGSSLVLVTHPRKAFVPSGKTATPTLDDLAGGAAFQRAAASVIWLANADGKPAQVETAHGEHRQVVLHAVMRVLKARNSTGGGSAIGFTVERLTFAEEGRLEPEDAIVRGTAQQTAPKASRAQHRHEPTESEDHFAAEGST